MAEMFNPRRVATLDAAALVPGHGEPMRDRASLASLMLVRDLLRSAVEQVNGRVHVVGPAEFRTLEEIAPRVDLSPFRRRFAGDDAALGRRTEARTAVRIGG